MQHIGDVLKGERLSWLECLQEQRKENAEKEAREKEDAGQEQKPDRVKIGVHVPGNIFESMERYELTPHERLLYIVIRRYANKKTYDTFISKERMRGDTGLSRRYLDKAIQGLIDKGWIHRSERMPYIQNGGYKSRVITTILRW